MRGGVASGVLGSVLSARTFAGHSVLEIFGLRVAAGWLRLWRKMKDGRIFSFAFQLRLAFLRAQPLSPIQIEMTR